MPSVLSNTTDRLLKHDNLSFKDHYFEFLMACYISSLCRKSASLTKEYYFDFECTKIQWQYQ